MPAPQVNVVCRNWQEDRVIPRMARFLAERLDWTLTAAPDPNAEAVYLLGYFEAQKMKRWPNVPVAAYFSHREEEPPGNAKAKLYDATAAKVSLRVATCKLYAEGLEQYGPTMQVHPPLEWNRFKIAERRTGGPAGGRMARKPIVGFSGYTYAFHRKGEDIAKSIISSGIGKRLEWRASGRGWPVETKRYTWKDMPKFYQGLDVLVVPSRVEGVPMPPLEALACGVRVVIPRGVGLLDELPEVPGIHRYERGDLKSLLVALEAAAFSREPIDREALRAATKPYSVEAWCEDHNRGFAPMLLRDFAQLGDGCPHFGYGELAGIDVTPSPEVEAPAIEVKAPVNRKTGAARGIYCVAFGEPSRKSALRLMESAKRYMPDIPIALCAISKIGPEDVLIKQQDTDVGGRRAKLRAYELAPAEWQAVLYLDADTEVVAPIYQYFEWIEDGWEFVICKDPHLMDEMVSFERRNNKRELAELEEEIRTLHALQFNGGVWAFARNERVAAFFQRWRAEWERHAQRDQAALVRALYADPLRVWLLGNEWNTFPRYSRGVTTAGLMHYPGEARRWKGLIPGRIDSKEAWAMVKRFEGQRRHGK